MAREVRVAILGDSRDFSRAVRGATSDANRLSNMGSKLASFGKVAALGLGAAAVGAVAMGKSFIDAANESQKVTRQTEAVIKSMGLQAKASADDVAELSTQLSLKTGIDDELIQSGSNLLLTFKNLADQIGNDSGIWERANAAALDMSVAMGTDMTQSAMMLGKALNDPILGLTAMRRVGIQFTEQQQEQIKAMVEVGDVAGAQAVMLAELERQFGGSAEAQATAADKLGVAWGNIQEQLGELLLPMFNNVATWLTTALPQAVAVATPIMEALAGFFVDAYEKVKAFTEDALAGLAAWWAEHGPEITETLGNLAAAFNEHVVPALQGFYSFMVESVLPVLADLTAWILKNEPVLIALAATVGVTLTGAFVKWAAAAVVATASTIGAAAAVAAAAAPFIALAGLAVALAMATDKLINSGGILNGVINSTAGFFIDLIEWGQRLAGTIRVIISAVGQLIDKLRTLKNNASSGIGLGLSVATGGVIGGRAKGGRVRAGGKYLVGEEGPEILELGGMGGNIVPNDETMRQLEAIGRLNAKLAGSQSVFAPGPVRQGHGPGLRPNKPVQPSLTGEGRYWDMPATVVTPSPTGEGRYWSAPGPKSKQKVEVTIVINGNVDQSMMPALQGAAERAALTVARASA